MIVISGVLGRYRPMKAIIDASCQSIGLGQSLIIGETTSRNTQLTTIARNRSVTKQQHKTISWLSSTGLFGFVYRISVYKMGMKL